MRRHAIARATVAVAVLAVAGCAERRYTPPKSDLMSQPDRHPAPAYDVWGRSVSKAQADQLVQTDEGRAMLSPANGAVRIDDAFLDLGKRTFYEKTFGNEVFLTDVMGITAGPITPPQISKAVLALKGAGTGNLQVGLASDATVGGVQYRKGQKVDTGIDVPNGAIAPDPTNSLRALVDRDLRRRVTDANRSNADLASLRVEGIGRAFWVDPAAGFDRREQDALIQYLLTVNPRRPVAPADARPSVSTRGERHVR